MNQGQILIVSDDFEFLRALASSWRTDKDSPVVTAVSTEASRDLVWSDHALIVVGPLRQGAPLPEIPAKGHEAVICAVGDDDSLKAARDSNPAWLLIPGCPGWARIVCLLADEVLRRRAAETRAREIETAHLTQRRFGILGKSLQEARPGMVNALTSLLGNADLMMLSEVNLPDQCREQVQTIHNMALRLSEIVQRLSSIENEMELSERKSHVETREMAKADAVKT